MDRKVAVTSATCDCNATAAQLACAKWSVTAAGFADWEGGLLGGGRLYGVAAEHHWSL